MQYCKRCILPETHSGLSFDNEGICSQCRAYEEKDRKKWDQRLEQLKKIVAGYRSKDGSNYDCIVPVSGGKDSFFTCHIITKVLNLNPLLVSFNTQFNTKKGIRNLARLLTEFDCDHLQYTIYPRLIKKIAKISIKKDGEMCWHCKTGSISFPLKAAVNFNIPLIVWGTPPLGEGTGKFFSQNLVKLGQSERKKHFPKARSWKEFAKETGITEKEMKAFEFPADEELEETGLRALYLCNFIRWDQQKQDEDMIGRYGFESGEQERTFDCYENPHCLYCDGTRDYLQFLKYGFGNAFKHASRDIRMKRMTREEAIGLAEECVQKKPSDLKIFLDWIGMQENELLDSIEPFRDKRAWKKEGNEWKRRDTARKHINDKEAGKARLKKEEERKYILTVSPESDEKDERTYLSGRRYINKRNFRAVTD